MTIVLDTETTGLHAGTDELLQISIIDDSGETLIDRYIRPESCTEWPEAEAVNGITPDMVRDCPHISDPDLHDRIQSVLYNADTIIGYNTQFDIGFLLAAGFAIPDVPQIDVMRDFAEIYGQISEEHGGYKWQKLTTAAAYYGYEWDIDAHNSLGDCRATLYVYQQIQHHNLLRCCPFCGQQAGYAAGVIRCVDCGLDVSASYDHLDIHELIQAYNRRANDLAHGAPDPEPEDWTRIDALIDKVLPF